MWSSPTLGDTWYPGIICLSKSGTFTWRQNQSRRTQSTNICAPNCVPCMKMIASSISLSVAGTETTPRLWLEATTTSSGCLTETRARRWPWRHHGKSLNQRQCSNHERCVPGAKGKRMKSRLTVLTSTRRFSTRPGILRRTSSLSQLPTTSFCSKRITNIHPYNITYFILSSNLRSVRWRRHHGIFSWRGGVKINLTNSHIFGGFLSAIVVMLMISTKTEDQSVSCFSLYS